MTRTASTLANTDAALRRCWHVVARSDEIGDLPHHVELLDDEWTIVRRPSTSGSVLTEWIPPRAPTTTPVACVTERNGYVFLAPEDPVNELLEVPEALDPTYLHGALRPVVASVGAGLLLDNFLDMSHFPFVHAATIGADDAEPFDLDIERCRLGFTVRSEHTFPNREDPGVAAGIRPLLQRRRLTYEYRAPFAVLLRVEYVEAGGTNVLDFYVQPIDDERCRIYTGVHRNDLDGDEHRLAEAVAYEARILDEDLVLQERYVDKRLPLDLTTEVHVKADRATVELRRTLAELVASVPA